MLRVLLKPTIFDKKAVSNRSINKIFAEKTKKNIDKHFEQPIETKVTLETIDFKEELQREDKKYKLGDLIIEEIIPEKKK